ncbi:amidohydrolase family protein [Acidianus sulfidivorans JP7]|uniref:Amidohydrolase 3 domain-containing protein n=1 Tax=Acidianus sulfidivorans JP7 TaxID=619593 RepID=A0A2U9ILB7_9CREN|nr:amidohydrolase family protein [Acidianus sulfidivorans]AWR96839.1 amidohydrolase family protein [Acidianus sulfidivorans JP7]
MKSGMLIKNVRFYEDKKIHDIYVEEGIIQCINCNGKKDDYVFDGKERLLIPPFVNLHSHLGYALTLNYARKNKSGTLQEGVIITRGEIAPKITVDDIEKRLKKLEKLFFVYGVLYVRTHEIIPIIFKFLEAKKTLSLINLQVVAFPSPGMFYEDNLDKTEKAIKEGAEVVGLIPNQEPTRDLGVESVKLAFDLAEKYNRMVDGHIDENDDPNSRFVEAVVYEALKRNWGEKTTISHMTASHSYPSDYFFRLLNLMTLAKVNVVSNPVVSTHLQGRYDNYPKRRGLARIRDMIKSGINVSLGTDNIGDAIYPLGDGNMLRLVQEAFLIDHFTAEEIDGMLKLVTWNPAKAMMIDYGIKPGSKAEFVILNAKSEYDAIRNILPPYLVVSGKNVAENDISFKINDNDVTDDVENLIN